MNKQSPKKLLFISSTLNTGGAQKILSNLLMSLPDDYETDILLNDDKKIVYPYRGNIISLGFPEQVDKTNLIYQIKVLFRRATTLKKIKKSKKYLASISFIDSANVANIVSGKRYCKNIITVHTDMKARRSQWKYKFLVLPLSRLLYGKADQVIAISDGVRDQLIHYLGLKQELVVTIKNGHDIQRIRQLAEEGICQKHQMLFRDKVVISTMGRMDTPKAQWHLIRAMKEVCSQIPNALLVILGDGEMKGYLVQLARDLGIEDHILFAGFVQNPFAYLKASDLFVLSSIFEGLPNALIESLGVGTPCVSTDFGSGVWEILDADQAYDPNRKKIKDIYYAEYGIITPVCDGVCYSAEDALTREECILSEAIVLMMKDEELQNKYRKKAEIVVKQFESSAMAEKWVHVIGK